LHANFVRETAEMIAPVQNVSGSCFEEELRTKV
jgi:hypothetical protein